MPDISEAELTLMENTIVKTREALSEDDSPEATQLKQDLLEIEQICSSKLDQTSSGSGDNLSGPTGGAVPEQPLTTEDEDMAMGAADSSISMEEFKAIGSHLQEAMSIIQKALNPVPSPPAGGPPPHTPIPKEAM